MSMHAETKAKAQKLVLQAKGEQFEGLIRSGETG